MKCTITRRIINGALSFALLAPFGAANAYSTFLTITNNQNWSQPQNFAEVTIDELIGGDLKFTIDLCGDPSSSACGPDPQGNPQNIEQFGFNITGDPNSVDLTLTDFLLPSTDWTVDFAPPPTTLDGFGGFDVVVKWIGSGAAGLDPLMFTISKDGDSIASYAVDGSTGGQPNAGSLFAAKISSTGPGAFIGGGSPVPVPAAIWLFGSGLLGLVGVARRRRS